MVEVTIAIVFLVLAALFGLWLDRVERRRHWTTLTTCEASGLAVGDVVTLSGFDYRPDRVVRVAQMTDGTTAFVKPLENEFPQWEARLFSNAPFSNDREDLRWSSFGDGDLVDDDEGVTGDVPATQ